MAYHKRAVDRPALRAYRLSHIQQQLVAKDFAGALLFDPVNIRYVTDCPNMQVRCLHNRVHYVFVPPQGKAILFEFSMAEHLAAGIETIGETRLLTSGPKTKPWLQECGDRVIEAGDLVSFDTDLIGPNGYCADISRSLRATKPRSSAANGICTRRRVTMTCWNRAW